MPASCARAYRTLLLLACYTHTLLLPSQCLPAEPVPTVPGYCWPATPTPCYCPASACPLSPCLPYLATACLLQPHLATAQPVPARCARAYRTWLLLACYSHTLLLLACYSHAYCSPATALPMRLMVHSACPQPCLLQPAPNTAHSP